MVLDVDRCVVTFSPSVQPKVARVAVSAVDLDRRVVHLLDVAPRRRSAHRVEEARAPGGVDLDGATARGGALLMLRAGGLRMPSGW